MHRYSVNLLRWFVTATAAITLTGQSSSCESQRTRGVWVHQVIEWPGLHLNYDDPALEASDDPLERALGALDSASIMVRDRCAVELHVCEAIGCPERSVDLYIQIAVDDVASAEEVGFSEAADGEPPGEEDGFRACEPF